MLSWSSARIIEFNILSPAILCVILYSIEPIKMIGSTVHIKNENNNL